MLSLPETAKVSWPHYSPCSPPPTCRTDWRISSGSDVESGDSRAGPSPNSARYRRRPSSASRPRGQISLRQFVLLWQCLDHLQRLAAMADAPARPPRTDRRSAWRMTTTPVRRLDIHRRLANGDRVRAGTPWPRPRTDGPRTSSTTRTIFAGTRGLSPFALPSDGELHRGPAAPHGGLQGVFGDSLPDGWGLLLMDRAFRRHGRASTSGDSGGQARLRGRAGHGGAGVRTGHRLRPRRTGCRGCWARSATLPGRFFEARAEEDVPVPAALGTRGEFGGRPPQGAPLPAGRWRTRRHEPLARVPD